MDTDDPADGSLNKLIQQIKQCERLPDGVTDLVDCAKNVYGRIFIQLKRQENCISVR